MEPTTILINNKMEGITIVSADDTYVHNRVPDLSYHAMQCNCIDMERKNIT